MIETKRLTTDIQQQMAALSPAQRALLELRLMKKNQREQTRRQVIAARQLKSAPLSYNQQGLWVLNQLMLGESVYHTPTAARLTGTLNVDALKKALQSLIDRHDALRTVFKIVDGAPTQVIQDVKLEIPVVDLTIMREAEREAEALRILRYEARRPFDLSRGPLIRSVIVRIGNDEHILLVTMHHIVMDDGSGDAGSIVPGASSTLMLKGNGGNYHCENHPTMVGSINSATAPDPPSDPNPPVY